tara:strand:+ start:173 stop:355 length:183 start_codon:yes stop_codon:yes gene_type:complete
MSNKERIAELKEIIRVMNPKSTLKFRIELDSLLEAEAEAEAPKEPIPVKIVKKVKKPKKS